MKLNPTEEQKEILLAVKKNSGDIRINAYAGSGKSSTLRMIAEKNPDKNFLYLAYNKAVAKEAEDTFPANCEVKTVHSLAFGQVLSMLGTEKGRFFTKLNETWKLRDYMRKFNMDDFKHDLPPGVPHYEFCSDIKYLVTKFKLSDLQEIDTPLFSRDQKKFPKMTQDLMIRVARRIWEAEKDMSDKTPLDHNTYLKMWELSSPGLDMYDFVLFDECFPSSHAVATEQGRKTFNELLNLQIRGKTLPRAKSFNEETQQIEYKKIVSVFKNSSKDEMLRVTISGKFSVKCTPNHKFFTSKGWVPADQLEIGDLLYFPKNSTQFAKPLLSKDEISVLAGSILGDGGLGKISENSSRLRILHCSKQREYALWKGRFFSDSTTYQSINKGFSRDLQTVVNTKAFNFVGDPFEYAIKNLDDLAIAILIGDDGAISNNCLLLHVNSLNDDQAKKVSEKINQIMGVRGEVKKYLRADGRSFNQINYNTEDTSIVFRRIRNFLPECLHYKFPSRVSPGVLYEPSSPLLPLDCAPITEVEKVKEHHEFVCDIEVEDNHNYFVSSNKRIKGEILVHNCQDANPSMNSVVSKLPMNRIFVGDQHQAIYGFNGAVNAMQNIEPDFDLFLSKSWRFGPAIASAANRLLSSTGPLQKDLIGNEAIESVLGPVNTDEVYTIIFRTNGALALEALDLMKKEKKVYVEGGVSDLCNDLRALYYLKRGEIFKEAVTRYKPFRTFGEVCEESKIDITIRRDLAFVEKFGNSTPQMLDFLELNIVSKRGRKKANVILTTAHKSKGLEWDQVHLYDDFKFKVPETLAFIPRSEREEINLLYVSITRAKKVLQLSPAYEKFVQTLENLKEKGT